MNELPLHVFVKILDYLLTVDAIRCRAVCKSWLDLIDQFVLDELNVFYEQRQSTKYLQFRNRFMDPNRSISFGEPTLHRLLIGNDSEQFGCLFRNLKKFSFEQNSEESIYTYALLEKWISTFIRSYCA